MCLICFTKKSRIRLQSVRKGKLAQHHIIVIESVVAAHKYQAFNRAGCRNTEVELDLVDVVQKVKPCKDFQAK